MCCLMGNHTFGRVDFHYTLPVACFLSGKKSARIWNIVLSSIFLFYSGATLLLASFELFVKAVVGIGAYLFVLIGIGFFVISLIQNKMPADRQHDSRVLDQLP